MYFNINTVTFLKDIHELFPLDVFGEDSVFYVDEKDLGSVTVTDPKNSKEQKYLRMYLHEEDDVPTKDFLHDEDKEFYWFTPDVIDKFSGEGLYGNSQTFLIQGATLYVSEKFLKQLERRFNSEDGDKQPIPEIIRGDKETINTLDSAINCIEKIKAKHTAITLKTIATHTDGYLIDDEMSYKYDFYIDLFDLLVKASFTRSEANKAIQFILSAPETLKPILSYNGLMVWQNTVFIKVSTKTLIDFNLPTSPLFDTYEPRKILNDVLSFPEDFKEDTHGNLSDVHVFKFTQPIIYSSALHWVQFRNIQLFTMNPRFHKNELNQRTEDVLKAIDVESGLHGNPQMCYTYFRAMEKDCVLEGHEHILTPNNIGYNTHTGGHDITVNEGEQIFHIGHGLYMKLNPTE